MRQKITGASEAAADLPELTDKQEKFVQGLLAGLKTVDAYRAAYDCSGMSSNSVWREASVMSRHSKIAQWLAAAREACMGAGTVSLEGHLQQLERIREIALASGNIGAAVAAEQSRGKVTGHYIDQVRDVTAAHDSAATIRQLAELTGADPFVIAAKYGVDLPDEGATKH
jgi:hypothetical protein